MTEGDFHIYTQNNCSYCYKAKQLLKSKGIVYEEYNLSDDPSAVQFLKKQGFKKVPQIFVDYGYRDEHIGGYDDLVKWLENFEVSE